MKKKYFSKTSINIVLISIILIICILTAFYHFNLDKVINNTNDFFNQQDDNKIKVDLVKCIDGDTAEFKLKNQNIKMRFLAIDTPEVKKNNMGGVAKDYTCNLLNKAKQIEISYEPGLTSTDKYNRHLGWVFVDDDLIQEKLIEVGYAKVRYIYAKYKYTNRLLKLQKVAQEKKVGIWSKYKSKKYDDERYVVVFKIDDNSRSVEVKAGEIISLINNPSKKGFTFTGWTLNGKLYDFSKPITKHLIVDAKFDK